MGLPEPGQRDAIAEDRLRQKIMESRGERGMGRPGLNWSVPRKRLLVDIKAENKDALEEFAERVRVHYATVVDWLIEQAIQRGDFEEARDQWLEDALTMPIGEAIERMVALYKRAGIKKAGDQ
jgi:hypothetical protein